VKRKSKRQNINQPRTLRQYSDLSSNRQEQWIQVLHAISKMRSHGLSLREASEEVGLSPDTLTALGRQALLKDARGRYRAKRKDRLLRVLILPSPDGLQEVTVNDSETASEIAKYSDAVQKYLRTGDASKLRQFAGMRLTDADGNPIELITDLQTLRRLGSAGVLSFESLYARVS